jgi:hypothetical protein
MSPQAERLAAQRGHAEPEGAAERSEALESVKKFVPASEPGLLLLGEVLDAVAQQAADFVERIVLTSNCTSTG